MLNIYHNIYMFATIVFIILCKRDEIKSLDYSSCSVTLELISYAQFTYIVIYFPLKDYFVGNCC